MVPVAGAMGLKPQAINQSAAMGLKLQATTAVSDNNLDTHR
jgi:hypothetical protein